MRDIGAPAVIIEGCIRDTLYGPRMVATLAVSAAMGDVAIMQHPSYRRAMQDAAGMVMFVRMAAHNASGIDPVTASRVAEEVSWNVIVLPTDVVLIGRTADADFGPFLLSEHPADDHRLSKVARQLEFAGISVG
ncbi:hypothetical protein [Azospirillum rugosum]|uniref:Uncharacterized protein n=1 Tax=Azospirillum rugosum TaxID=416170 RepID=A0ABS4SR76_9PROT|nr:hypothetical protein [Azospirillum rugosum]MBP2295076.1 hypothetical protein [Azospirillum rugosum]MDQ0528899.1 hypothetical protein [Azospirillum rugosum]